MDAGQGVSTAQQLTRQVVCGAGHALEQSPAKDRARDRYTVATLTTTLPREWPLSISRSALAVSASAYIDPMIGRSAPSAAGWASHSRSARFDVVEDELVPIRTGAKSSQV
jgi:hypothetical protein